MLCNLENCPVHTFFCCHNRIASSAVAFDPDVFMLICSKRETEKTADKAGDKADDAARDAKGSAQDAKKDVKRNL